MAKMQHPKKIAVFVNTPAQLYFYKNIIKQLIERGHEFRILLRDYGDTVQISNELNNDYFIYCRTPVSKFGKMISVPYGVLNAYKYLKKFGPDVIIGPGVYDAFTANLLDVDCIQFSDTEPNKLSHSFQLKLYMRFEDVILTPEAFLKSLGKKHIKINSYKELAYLHPKYFKPNNSILSILNLNQDEDYVILRFNALDAVHDVGLKGFNAIQKIRLVMGLEKYAKVFISSESVVPTEIMDRVIKIPKNRIHDALYYAKLLVTDTGTMATEAAILGTPTVRYSPFDNNKELGNFVELMNKYKLLFNCNDGELAIEKAIESIRMPDSKQKLNEMKIKLLSEKIDISSFMAWFVENYPDSFEIMKDNPKYQNKFK